MIDLHSWRTADGRIYLAGKSGRFLPASGRGMAVPA